MARAAAVVRVSRHTGPASPSRRSASAATLAPGQGPARRDSDVGAAGGDAPDSELRAAAAVGSVRGAGPTGAPQTRSGLRPESEHWPDKARSGRVGPVPGQALKHAAREGHGPGMGPRRDCGGSPAGGPSPGETFIRTYELRIDLFADRKRKGPPLFTFWGGVHGHRP